MNSENEKKAKPEVKKLEDMLPFNPYKVLGLRPKKIDEQYKKYVGLNRRMIASTIDTLIASLSIAPIIQFILDSTVKVREVTSEEIERAKMDPDNELANLFQLLIDSGKLTEILLSSSLQVGALLIASAICWKLWSATPGKMLMRMKVVDAQTELPLSNQQIVLRCFGYIVSCSVLFAGIIYIAFNKRKQGWHDLMANSVVITTPKKLKPAKEMPAPLV